MTTKTTCTYFKMAVFRGNSTLFLLSLVLKDSFDNKCQINGYLNSPFNIEKESGQNSPILYEKRKNRVSKKQ